MKIINRKYILTLTLVIIFALLGTQVRWIFYSINFQEKVFQKSVELALNQTIANLTENQPLCKQMKACVACDTVKLDVQLTSAGVWEKIHDAIDAELNSYEIYLDYELLILETGSEDFKTIGEKLQKGRYYSRCLGGVLGQTGYQLVVKFPSRTMYFLEKTGLMFLASVVLILLLIMALSYLLRLYKQELRIAEHTKELLNNVSHEFKTPLTSIALASNMIRKKRYANEAKLENYADLISKENKKLQNLVESLLHLAAIERDEFEYSKENLNIDDVIQEGVSTFEMIMLERTGNISVQLNAENKTVYADKLHLVNVIVNLISNGIKYSKDSLELAILTENVDDYIFIRVTDKGIGIPLKYQKYIFDKYYRVPTGDVHDVKGFGIGLAYVKKVVEAQGGSISVESQVDEGSTFTIKLPLINKRND